MEQLCSRNVGKLLVTWRPLGVYIASRTPTNPPLGYCELYHFSSVKQMSPYAKFTFVCLAAIYTCRPYRHPRVYVAWHWPNSGSGDLKAHNDWPELGCLIS